MFEISKVEPTFGPQSGGMFPIFSSACFKFLRCNVVDFVEIVTYSRGNRDTFMSD